MKTIAPGLKAHQTHCIWASDSLDISFRVNLVINQVCKRKEKERQKKIEEKKEIGKIANQGMQRRKEIHIFTHRIVMILSKNYTLQFTRYLARGVWQRISF
jgi:hypothetical protein